MNLNVEQVFVLWVQTPWDSERDEWWDEAMSDSSEDCEPEWLDAEDPLFILYTSGSTGKPKVMDLAKVSFHSLSN